MSTDQPTGQASIILHQALYNRIHHPIENLSTPCELYFSLKIRNMKQIYLTGRSRIFHLLAPLLWLLSFKANATNYPISGTYSGSQEVPANSSTATGTITGVYNDFTNTIFYTISFSGLSSNSTAAHFHGPAAVGVGAGVMIAYAGFPTSVTSGTYSSSNVLTDAQEANLLAGLVYSNIHSVNFGAGEIRAQIVVGAASSDIYSINNTYSGAQEVPPNASTGTGTFIGAYNKATNTIFYTITFRGLDSTTTAAHFHAPAAPGVSAGIMLAHAGFPTGIDSGSYSRSDVLHDTAEAHLLANLVYSNIHTIKFPAGEVRAQLTPQLPPVITCPGDTTARNDSGLCSASLSFNATATGIPTPTIKYTIAGGVVTWPYVFPVGKTTVSAIATNAAGTDTCTFMVTVKDVEPPVLKNVDVSTKILWPPNHKMKDVKVNYTATDNCGGIVTSSLSVSSNQPQNGTGDGNTESDWTIVDDHNVKLRAERAGNGGCRIYSIKITSKDQYGNSRDSIVTVIVPHDMSNQHECDLSYPAGIIAGNIIGIKKRHLNLSVLPNPSYSNFIFTIRSSVNTRPLTIRIVDLMGRLVEMRSNLQPNQTIQMGGGLPKGQYIVELRQDNEITYLHIMKLE
jgi:hypothetical protein